MLCRSKSHLIVCRIDGISDDDMWRTIVVGSVGTTAFMRRGDVGSRGRDTVSTAKFLRGRRKERKSGANE